MTETKNGIQEPREIHKYLLDKSSQEEYCRKYGIEIVRLNNGLQVVSMHRPVPDKASAEINVSFARGSVNDPVDKKGLLHLLDHMMYDPGLLPEASNRGAYFNAMTGPSMFLLELSGTANTDVLDYGVWDYVPKLTDVIKNPLKYNTPEINLERHKAIIKREMHELEVDASHKAQNFLRRRFFTSDSLVHDDIMGIKGEINDYTIADLRELAQEVLIPENTLVTIFTEGNPDIQKRLLNQIAEQMDTLPKGNRTPSRADPYKLATIKPDFVPGANYVHRSMNMAPMNHVVTEWVLPYEYLSAMEAGLGNLWSFLGSNIYDHIRNSGIAYSMTPHSASFMSCRTVGLEIPVQPFPNRDDIIPFVKQQLLPDIMFQIQNMSRDELHSAAEISQRRDAANKSKYETVFELAVNGIAHHGKIIDFDKYRESSVTHMAENFIKAHQAFAALPPTTLII